jgi:uncharacterized protein
MESKNIKLDIALIIFVVGIALMATAYFTPWKHISWGKVKIAHGDIVTVTGEAKTKQKNQKATFSAGVNAISDNKETAIADVNKKVQAIVDAVKTFGIGSDDVKTQHLNVYQNEEQYYEDGRQKFRQGQWRVSNTVEITLTDVDRASELADILTKSGANNIYGPNFVVDDTGDTESGLLDEALKNAREKANKIATSVGRTLGQVTSVTEGYQPMPVYRMEGGGGGGGLEPGSATVTKTVTVTYELAP